MNAKFKKFLFALVTVVLGAMSSGAMAAPTYTATVNGTSYNFTYFTGSYNANISNFSKTLMPWWGNSSSAQTFAAAVGVDLGRPFLGSYGPFFAYEKSSALKIVYSSSVGTSISDTTSIYNYSYPFATATVNTGAAAVPEIDGALIPQVGLLIAGLFLILGRKKQNPEPMLARLS